MLIRGVNAVCSGWVCSYSVAIITVALLLIVRIPSPVIPSAYNSSLLWSVNCILLHSNQQVIVNEFVNSNICLLYAILVHASQ